MSLSDPAGMLRRMPELERIAAQEPSIAAAVATGDTFKVYGALRWASWLGRLNTHQEPANQLLANRRLFAKPLDGSPPSLHTINSFGVGFVGEGEHDTDGTYITGHYVVIFFKLPLFPLGAYVVAPGGDSGAYRIFARVPQSGFAWVWSRLVAVAVALLIASAAWGSYQDSLVGKVTIANGFQQPMEIELGGQHATVPAGSTAELTLPIGMQNARATIGGKVVDEGPINVSSGLDALVWNVGGVAPVFKYEVNYYEIEPAWPPPPRIDYFCGQRVVAENRVDYLFRDPDKSVSMGKSQKVATRIQLSAFWREPGETRSPCITQLYFHGKAKELATVADSLVRAGELAPEEETLPVVTALLAREDETGWKQAQSLHERRAGDLIAERAVIWAAEETGHLDELRKELTTLRDEKPDDADRTFLLVRAGEQPPTLAEAEALLKKFPEHDGLARMVELAATREGQWDRSLAMWLQRFEKSPGEACEDAELVTSVAVSLHREAQVLEALDECPVLPFPALLSATRLAMAVKEDTQPWLDRLSSEQERQRLRIFAGLPVTDVERTPLERTARFVAAAHKSPDALFAELPTLPPEELQAMDTELALLVWAEAVRRNDNARLTFARRTRLTAGERTLVERFVAGTEKELDTRRFTPLVRSVAYLARSRVPSVAPAERERLQKLVRENALLSGFVLSTLEHWPSP